MDLAIGAKKIFVMMELLTKAGESKVVQRCTYPLTGIRCVSHIYTDLAVIDVTTDGLSLVEIADDMSVDDLRGVTGVEILT